MKELEDNLETMRIKFGPSSPLLPLEQLMAVLPPMSSHALPKEHRKLMNDPDSPLKDFYPNDVVVDMNGEKFAWRGVSLLPFIQEKRLLNIVKPLEATLTEG